MGVRGVSRGRHKDFKSGGVEGVPDTPRVKMKIDMHITTRENKILTHGLNEKNPAIM